MRAPATKNVLHLMSSVTTARLHDLSAGLTLDGDLLGHRAVDLSDFGHFWLLRTAL